MLAATVLTVKPDRWEDRLGSVARVIAAIDAQMEAQVNAIIHHPRFKRLEESWRGLHFLTSQVSQGQNVKICVLNVKWTELARDEEKAVEFDQSELFQKVYSQEFDMPGGEPYGLLIGDYEIQLGPNAEHAVDDIAVLRGVSRVAAAAFAPFVTGIDPGFFGVHHFSDLTRGLDLASLLRREEYSRWRRFRQTPDARFVGVVLPRMLLRRLYRDDGARLDGFAFSEADCTGSTDYLWGNAAYAFAAVVLRAFERSGWPAEIRGVQQNPAGIPLAAGGLVEGLPVEYWDRDRAGQIPKIATEVLITARQEKMFAEHGFIVLCHARPAPWAVFYSAPSVHEPQRYNSDLANANAQFGTQLQYTLCAARFAHYVKVMAQDNIGTLSDAAALEQHLEEWLRGYTTANVNLSMEDKARMPLRAAKVKVMGEASKPGSLFCTLSLLPHYQLEQLVGTMALDVNAISTVSPFQIEVMTAVAVPGSNR